VSGQLAALLAFGTTQELTDGQLLERFATIGGEAAEFAFSALVERHGPMVLRVCRSVLSDPHDAEDAFQATFLVLVRKGRGLWVEDSLGPWLHQVALRTASCARSAAARRRRHERAAMTLAAATMTTAHDAPDSDLERLLHEEIDRLPERFRMPVVLCDLEGCSHDQAARHLGWPVGTVKSRLARARERLKGRLTCRGLAPESGVAIAPSLCGLDDVLPTALVRSTTLAAVRFAASRTIVDGAVATLAYGVFRAMSMTQLWKLGSILLVAGATVTGAGILSGGGPLGGSASAQGPATKPGTTDHSVAMPVFPIQRGRFQATIDGRGTVEAAQSHGLSSHVEGQTTIISLLAEGTKVKKGDLVCEMDSASLRDQLTNQRIINMTAQANYQNARLARETAEIAVKEYQEGIYPADRATIIGEIKLAESNLANTRARLERTERARKRLADLMPGRAVTPADVLAELDLDDRNDSLRTETLRDQITLEKMQGKLNLLDNFTKPKVVNELRSEVEKARADELAKRQRFELEKSKEEKIEKQIVNCKLYAPGDGYVVYANSPNRAASQARPQIEENATVREGQRILTIVDLGAPMQVNVKVAEAWVDRVQPGQRVAVAVDAFPEAKFTGVVTGVAPLPDPFAVATWSRKVYSTLVKLDGIQAMLRPGMTAQAEIVLEEHENAISVPVDSIVHFEDRDHVQVRRPDGRFEWREVTLGVADPTTQLIEVKQGLEPGEQVALKPLELMSEYEKRQKGLGEPTKPARKKAADPSRATRKQP
jgi:RND family efflux transporter MFP subunit